MARRRNVYLGRRVPDVGKPGLDTLKEVGNICKAILEDYEKGRISYAKAMRRLTFLQTTVIKRSSELVGKKKRAYEIVEKAKRALKRIRKKKEGDGEKRVGKKSRKGKKNKGKKRNSNRKSTKKRRG